MGDLRRRADSRDLLLALVDHLMAAHTVPAG
jgi:hypothetical protein